MLCEMCGSEVPRTKLVVVESAAVNVCANCEKYATSEAVRTTEGEIVMPSVAQRLSVRQRRQRPRDVFETGEERELALDYPDRVRNSRRSLSLSQEELAKQINERKSVIVQIEGGSMRPNDKLVAKLERALKTSLREKMEGSSTTEKRAFSEGMTLGDFVRYED